MSQQRLKKQIYIKFLELGIVVTAFFFLIYILTAINYDWMVEDPLTAVMFVVFFGMGLFGGFCLTLSQLDDFISSIRSYQTYCRVQAELTFTIK